MTELQTPCGRLWVGADDTGRPYCGWAELVARPRRLASLPAEWRLPDRLAAWFADPETRRFERFRDLPLPAGTPFEDRCRSVLRELPPGKTVSYGELAARSGRPGAARAVGRAMRANPAPLLVPCHRVVAARGRLGGYAGTGGGGRSIAGEPHRGQDSRMPPALRIKQALLDLEASLGVFSRGESPTNLPKRLQSTSVFRR